LRLIEADLYFI